MPSLYDIKPRFQALLRPLVGRLAALGFTPNLVTMYALVLSVSAGFVLTLRPGATVPLLVLPAVLLVRMALNAIDGMLAREHDQVSRLGAFLNELGDVVSDAALYLPLALHPSLPGPLVVVVVVLALIGEMAGVLAQVIGGERRYDGPLGKSDRALAFGGLALALGLGIPPGRWTSFVLVILAMYAVITIVNRVRAALR